MDLDSSAYLLPTPIVDSDHEAIVAYAKDAVKDAGSDPVAKAVKLYYAVRDVIWYDPYLPFYRPEHYRASNVLEKEFDGCQDSIFQSFNTENIQFMDYVADHGTYAEVPVGKIVAAWKKEYGEHRIQQWIEGYENSAGGSGRDFSGEEVI